jgi:hypothetical protein
MGTRGAFGFKYRGIYYMFYNNSDSYFTYLGIKLLKEIKNMLENKCMDAWISKLLSLKLISEVYTESKDYTTTTDIDAETKDNIKKLFNGYISSYELALTTGYVDIDNVSIDITKLYNDVFMEYVYVLNLDDKKIEISKYNSVMHITFAELENTNDLYVFEKF